jgi:hypothetical protein
MTSFAILLLLAQAGAQPTDAAVGPPPAKRTPITIHTAEAPGVQVFFMNLPWGPGTFAAMERPGKGFYNRRSWPFARMETTDALRVGDTELPPGNYALVFHPNTPDDTGMSLEVRKIPPGEFLRPGNVMTRTPEGETLWQGPARFEIAEKTVPALEVGITREEQSVKIDVHYGNRTTQAVFGR